ncbi:MAG: hypothetical protein HYR55_03700 [Acidobacteria bacterium]|nr:hypothetical protein [Acidobacteriota bacterium]MBI3656074.1 hypothetical protein [Acidobacteriota bacterium]
MTKILRAIVILTILALLFIPTLIALRYAALHQIFSYFVDSASRLLAINQYLIKAAVALALMPFLYALMMTFSFDKTRGSVPGTCLTPISYLQWNSACHSIEPS